MKTVRAKFRWGPGRAHGRVPSLARRLILALIAFQLLANLAIPTVSRYLFWQWEESDGEGARRVISAVAESLALDPKGNIVIPDTARLDRFAARSPNLWFAARVGDRVFLHGPVPGALWASVGKNAFHAARRLDILVNDGDSVAVPLMTGTAAGPATIAAGGVETNWQDIAILLPTVLWETAVWFLLPVAIGTALLVWLLVRWLLSRLKQVAAAAGAIDPENLGQRLPTRDVPVELLPLVLAANSAFERLDSGYQRQRRFIADAAHELRTPIAILRTRLDGVSDGVLKESLLRDARRLSDLANQLLELQRVGGERRQRGPFDLVAVVRDVAADLAPSAVEAGYEIVMIAPDGPAKIVWNEADLRRVIANLVTNAIVHGGGRGTITIRLVPPGAVEVSDEGPGVPADLRERVFEPFYRGGRSGHGAGLGLPIAREIAHAYGGDVTAEDAPRGARFVLRLGCGDTVLVPGSASGTGAG